MQVVEPKVSTPSRLLIKTCFSCNFLAVMAKAIVTSDKRPSGTLATKIPIAKMRPVIQVYFTAVIAKMKKIIANVIAIILIIKINLSNSFLKGVF